MELTTTTNGTISAPSIERSILGAAFLYQEYQQDIVKALNLNDFTEYREVFKAIRFFVKEDGTFELSDIEDYLKNNGYESLSYSLIEIQKEATADIQHSINQLQKYTAKRQAFRLSLELNDKLNKGLPIDDTLKELQSLTKPKHEEWFKPLNPFTEPVTPLEFIINGVAAKGMITLLGGTAGSGKSILIQYLLQLRYNQPLLEVEDGKAIFLTGLDSSETEIRRRAKSIGQGEGLYTVAIPDDTVPFITNDVFFEELKKQLINMGADAVVFDTVADFHEGNLYDASEVNLTMSAFRRLASSTGCAIILITHTRKSADSKRDFSINDIADSRIFATKSDFVFALKSEYQNDETNLIELRCLKSRSPKPKAPVRAKIVYNEVKGRVSVIPSDRLFQVEESELDEQQRIENRRKEAKRLKDEGKSLREIGKILNTSHETIRKDLEQTESLSTVKNPS